MLNAGELQQLIFKIMNTDQSLLELNLFIRYCTAFSTAYLFSRRYAGKLSLEYAQADDAKMQQLAIDSIAELFARNDQGSFFKLIQYYAPLIEGIAANPDEAIFMTRRLVVAHTKQSLARSFQQNDPSGARIYRNLSLVPKRNPDIKLVKYGDEDYFYIWDKSEQPVFPDDLNPGYPEIEWSVAMSMLKQNKRYMITLPDMVGVFLNELKRNSEFRHFVCRNKLYQLLKQIYGMKILSMDNESPVSLLDRPEFLAISQVDQEDYADRIKTFIHREINQRFLKKSKIGKNEADIYASILNQYFEDLLMDGFAGKLPDYKNTSDFKEMEPELWKIHRGRLEYIIKLCRTELQTQYLHDFSNVEPVRIEEL